ncbi:hypothetical protein Anas_08168 [Armadillidium nasatum]|uniref:Uncharacterized protein n=1 Tax=Armadillidium nasatum TaxID=96803 RepID=A0A5N5TP24_9CRUS|nr:hypothetical protein Anas_08168 [Armadillidium nasatum]
MKNLNPLQQRIKEKLEEKCKIEKKDENNEVTKTVKKRYPDSAGFWFMLAMARVYLASVQTGYIHPDEFHQSLQMMS